jgi:hypothetical protein
VISFRNATAVVVMSSGDVRTMQDARLLTLVTAHVRPRHWTIEPTVILIFTILLLSVCCESALAEAAAADPTVLVSLGCRLESGRAAPTAHCHDRNSVIVEKSYNLTLVALRPAAVTVVADEVIRTHENLRFTSCRPLLAVEFIIPKPRAHCTSCAIQISIE